MDLIKNGWFTEVSTLWPGQSMSLKVEEVLIHEQSAFQDVLVFKSTNYGNVLVLDGVIQVTERDEFSYQEMIVHIPMNSHPNPKRVLIVGGGDGGAAREVLKHDIEEVVMCEIDKKVIEVSKKYLPSLAVSFADPRLTVHIGDGFEFMKKNQEAFDVIITDSSDPVGPAESLFQKSYFDLLKSALRPGGIVSSQGECLWLHLDIITNMQDFCKGVFPVVDYAYCTIPTYPSGQIGFTLCSLNPETNFKEPVREWGESQTKLHKLRYYNSAIHRAAFVLPEFARKAFKKESV
ncbi:spermidine synthase-like [Apostichopus japonicus]|uniref:spermidine synthase-like n=1 Tax=Stichopus japonicus TaxID=307972 RepID=UPI003AB112E6